MAAFRSWASRPSKSGMRGIHPIQRFASAAMNAGFAPDCRPSDDRGLTGHIDPEAVRKPFCGPSGRKIDSNGTPHTHQRFAAKERLDQQMLELLRAALTNVGQDAGQTGVGEWTLHELRPTGATGMAKLDVAPYVVDRILNNVVQLCILGL